MRRRTTYFMPRFIITNLILTIAVIVGVYAVRTTAVQRGIARAEALFRENDCNRGFSQLIRISHWADQHPVLISRLRCAAIVGHACVGDDKAAVAIADRMLAQDPSVPHPMDIWIALHQQVSLILDPIWLKSLGGLTPDPKAGYKTLMRELDSLDDDARAARLDAHTSDVPVPSAGNESPRPVPVASDAPVAPAPEPPATEALDFGDGRFAVACGASIRVYDSSGQHIGDLSAGALVTVTDIRGSDAGQVALCLREDALDGSPPMLVRTRDLAIRTGDLARIPDHVRDLLRRHATIESELRKEQRTLAELNPHAKAHKEATAKYKAFAADVQRLTAQRDAATGNERIRCVDTLHDMKNREPGIRKAYEDSKRQYKAWKASQADKGASAPQLASLQSRLDQVAMELSLYFDPGS